jgi:hypothetical protein
MFNQNKNVGRAQKFWWYVVLRGGLILGLLVYLPTQFFGIVILDLINGTWLHPYSRFTAEYINNWTNISYVAEQAAICFSFGAVTGLILWAAGAGSNEKTGTIGPGKSGGGKSVGNHRDRGARKRKR